MTYRWNRRYSIRKYNQEINSDVKGRGLVRFKPFKANLNARLDPSLCYWNSFVLKSIWTKTNVGIWSVHLRSSVLWSAHKEIKLLREIYGEHLPVCYVKNELLSFLAIFFIRTLNFSIINYTNQKSNRYDINNTIMILYFCKNKYT